VVLLVLCGLIVLVILAGLAELSRDGLNEFLEARRVSRTLRTLTAGGEFGADALLDLLGGVRSSRSATVVLRFACGRDLARSPGLALAISDLGAWVEAKEPAATLGPQVTHWIATSNRDARGAMNGVSGTVLDVMARAVEQAELERQRQEAPS